MPTPKRAAARSERAPPRDRAPITIKGFKLETQELMKRCARRQGQTLAEWLDRAVHMLARAEGVVDPVQAPAAVPAGGWAALAAHEQPNRFMLAPDQPPGPPSNPRREALRALLDASVFEVGTNQEWLTMASQLASTLASFAAAAHHASQASGRAMSKAAAGRVFGAVDSFAKLAKGEVPRSIAPKAKASVIPGQTELETGQTSATPVLVEEQRTRGLKHHGDNQQGRLPAHA